MGDRGSSITHLIRAKPPGEMGGADLHVAELAAAQAGCGHRVRVVTLGPVNPELLLPERRMEKVNISAMSTGAWLFATWKLVRSDPPDVVHSHGYRADLVAVILRLFRAPSQRWTLAVTVHGFITTSRVLRVLSRLNECLLRYADIVISVSSHETVRLTDRLRRRVVFIPNAVAHAELLPRPEACRRLGLDSGRQTVAFIGRLSAEKRPDLFVAMAALVARKRPETAFIIIGSGDLYEKTVQQAAATGTAISFAGLVPGVAALMECCDVLVCPSDTEGTPRVVVEAMLAGVPVVASRVGGLPDLIVDELTGLLAPPDSAAALAERVIRLLEDEEFSRRISGHASHHAKASFSMATMADRVTAAYVSGRNGIRQPPVDVVGGGGDQYTTAGRAS